MINSQIQKVLSRRQQKAIQTVGAKLSAMSAVSKPRSLALVAAVFLVALVHGASSSTHRRLGFYNTRCRAIDKTGIPCTTVLSNSGEHGILCKNCGVTPGKPNFTPMKTDKTKWVCNPAKEPNCGGKGFCTVACLQEYERKQQENRARQLAHARAQTLSEPVLKKAHQRDIERAIESPELGLSPEVQSQLKKAVSRLPWDRFPANGTDSQRLLWLINNQDHLSEIEKGLEQILFPGGRKKYLTTFKKPANAARCTSWKM